MHDASVEATSWSILVLFPFKYECSQTSAFSEWLAIFRTPYQALQNLSASE
jgi:hypothetical protein